MSDLSMLLVGLGLGLRHATDADHVIVVSSLVQRDPGLYRAAKIATIWGLGHAAAVLAVGVLMIVADVRLPPAFDLAAQLLVAGMLMALGVWQLWRKAPLAARSSHCGDALGRPLAIGLVHGLAGSTGIALLALAAIDSRAVALGYLGMVNLGSMVGMVVLTVAMTRPLGWLMRQPGRAKQALTMLTAVLSVGLGVALAVGAIAGNAHH